VSLLTSELYIYYYYLVTLLLKEKVGKTLITLAKLFCMVRRYQLVKFLYMCYVYNITVLRKARLNQTNKKVPATIVNKYLNFFRG